MPIPAPETLNELLTSTRAAQVAHVSVQVICNWKNRGWLTPARHDDRGRPLYRFIDVAKAERMTRDKARRTFPRAS